MYLRGRRWLCHYLGWHKPSVIWFDAGGPLAGAQGYSDCRYCGYSGMIDSQGNLF